MGIRALVDPLGSAGWWSALLFTGIFLVLFVRAVRVGVQVADGRFRTRNLLRSHNVGVQEIDHCELSGWWGGIGRAVRRDGSRLWLTGIQSRNFLTDRDPDRYSKPMIERLNKLVASTRSAD